MYVAHGESVNRDFATMLVYGESREKGCCGSTREVQEGTQSPSPERCDNQQLWRKTLESRRDAEVNFTAP